LLYSTFRTEMTTPPSIACAAKTQLRRDLLAARSRLTVAERSARDTLLAARLRHWLATHPVGVLGVYWPIRAEPDLRPLYAELAAAGVQLGLPVVAGPGLALAFVAWTPGEALVLDRLGIAVPALQRPIAPQALVIPCVGFSRALHRLGYGGGFYDRSLAPQTQSPSQQRPLAIGVADAAALVDFAAGPFDVPMDVIITTAAL
jgi:5-formyltetrahydrofolate cyclo-ligase